MNEPPLAGCRILVTRPAGRQHSLCNAIEAAGGAAISLPLLAIVAVDAARHIVQLKAKLGRLHEYHSVIFISANAARFGAERIADCAAVISPGAEVLAVGATTAREAALLLDRQVHSPATGSGSEQLLGISQLKDITGRKIAIFRGDGGRELLATELRKRGAEVDYFEVYRRIPASGALEQLAETLADGPPHYVVLTSAEALLRWRELLDEYSGNFKEQMTLLPSESAETIGSAKDILFGIPLAVPSQRVAKLAVQHGFAAVINAGDAGAKAIIEALAAHLRQRGA